MHGTYAVLGVERLKQECDEEESCEGEAGVKLHFFSRPSNEPRKAFSFFVFLSSQKSYFPAPSNERRKFQSPSKAIKTSRERLAFNLSDFHLRGFSAFNSKFCSLRLCSN